MHLQQIATMQANILWLQNVPTLLPPCHCNAPRGAAVRTQTNGIIHHTRFQQTYRKSQIGTVSSNMTCMTIGTILLISCMSSMSSLLFHWEFSPEGFAAYFKRSHESNSLRLPRTSWNLMFGKYAAHSSKSNMYRSYFELSNQPDPEQVLYFVVCFSPRSQVLHFDTVISEIVISHRLQHFPTYFFAAATK